MTGWTARGATEDEIVTKHTKHIGLHKLKKRMSAAKRK